MTHKCFQCDRRFATSAQMVLHMKEAHSSYVQDAQDKIDRSKEQYAKSFVNTAAICPYCQANCQTRKKLMRHLEEHKDFEPDEEEELKIISITNENSESLLEQFDGDKSCSTSKSGGSGSSSAASTSGPTFVQNLIRAIESDPAKIASSKIKVSSTSVRLPERRYKCFWCDTSFRKRGKLMDHIDMFHKDNKQQTELEAELLQGAREAAQEPEKPKPTASRTSSNASASSTIGGGKQAKEPARSRQGHHGSAKNRKRSCVFRAVGSIREVCRVKAPQPAEKENGCRFFFRAAGDPLVQVKAPPLDETPATPPDLTPAAPPAVKLVHASPALESPPPAPVKRRRSSSILSSCSQPPAAPPPPLQTIGRSPARGRVSDRTSAAVPQPMPRSYRHPAPGPIYSRPLAPPLYPQLPYYMPPSDIYLHRQHSALMVEQQQRSQLQYMSYMQSFMSPQSHTDPNKPLDLSAKLK